jgi:hypothetical protein
MTRIVTAGIMKHQWPPYMSEIFRVLKPGTGWAQCIEFQGHRFFSETSVPENSALREVYPSASFANSSLIDTLMKSLKIWVFIGTGNT